MNNNTNDDHGCYVVRLNRLFSVPKDAAIPILCAVVCFIGIAIVSFFTDRVQSDTVLLAGILCIGAPFAYLLNFPRLMEVTPGSIKVESHGGLYHLLTHRRIYGTLSDYDKQTTVYNITSIQYLQTPIERFFNVGRVYAVGDVLIIQGECKSVHEGSLTVCGVKDFDNTSAWMKSFMKLTEE
jgi:hypothetical protein